MNNTVLEFLEAKSGCISMTVSLAYIPRSGIAGLKEIHHPEVQSVVIIVMPIVY